MLLKTILNRVQKYPGFVYDEGRLIEEDGGLVLEIGISHRSNGRAICSGCGRRCPGYDRLPARRFEFVPLWNIPVYFRYSLRRVHCRLCGVLAEEIPWAKGKSQMTTTYSWFLARWAKRMSWKEVAEAFKTSWEKVFRSVEMAVAWGRAHQDLEGVEALGVDEIQWQRGHKYLTLVYETGPRRKRLLFIGRDRETQTLTGFFDWFGECRSRALKFVCSDMWKPYINVIAARAGQALHVLDRFHIAAKLSKAIDEVRAGEAREMAAKGFVPLLKGSRWCLLKRPENMTVNQGIKLAELLRCNLRTVRSYLLKEDLQLLWEFGSPTRAASFLQDWCNRTLRSRIEPMKKVARTLRNHEELILNWFKAEGMISGGVVEGFNNKAKLTTRKAYGFRTFEAAETALYHTLGDLPEPEVTHEFC
jgi:transposase